MSCTWSCEGAKRSVSLACMSFSPSSGTGGVSARRGAVRVNLRAPSAMGESRRAMENMVARNKLEAWIWLELSDFRRLLLVSGAFQIRTRPYLPKFSACSHPFTLTYLLYCSSLQLPVAGAPVPMLLGALRRATCLRAPPQAPWVQKVSSKPLSFHAARWVVPSSAQSPLTALRLSFRHARTHSVFTAHESPLRASRIRFFSANASGEAAAPEALPVLSPRSVGFWLLTSSTLVFAIIVVGGVTRLTESGLSITEWRPITGVLPPLTHEEWVAEFDKYKATPEFKMCVSFSIDWQSS